METAEACHSAITICEVDFMDNKERTIHLLDSVPEDKVDCVIAYMQGIIAGADATRKESKDIFNMWENDSKN